jgi:membrane protease YdiL (CAAX protease family)
MDPLNMILVVGALGLFGGTTYVANQQQIMGTSGTMLRALLYGVLGLMVGFSFTILQYSLVDVSGGQEPASSRPFAVDGLAGSLHFAATLAAGYFCLRVINSEVLRRRLQGWLGRTASFNPESPVHLTAFVLMVMMLSLTLGQLILSGGVSGLAQTYETQGVSLRDVVFNQVVWLMFALLGVGLFLRRTPAQAAERLGLRFPATADIVWGVGIGLAAFGLIIVFGLLSVALFSPEQLEAQNAASQQIARAFGTLPAALVMSGLVAVGEEVLFRGALQPVFGIPVTSIFFVLLHVQYALSPATLALLIVTLMFAELRRRFSTTSAVIAHFIYNFVQLALASFAISLGV